MTIIGYIRVSTEDQAREGVSLDAQEAKIRQWADLHGHSEIRIHTDAGISGKRADNRPGLAAALAEIRRGDVLVVYSLSRLARSTHDTLEIAERLEKSGGDLVSLSERIDSTSAAGKMIFRMLAVLGEFERDQISERTRMALSQKRAVGKKTGGTVPFGFILDGEKLIPDPTEQKVIRSIRRLRSSGKSLRQIAANLERRGIKTKQGLPRWNPKVVANLLRAEPHQAGKAR